MRTLFIIVAVVIIVGSLAADYLWRRWVAARRQERENQPGDSPHQR